MRSAAVLQAWLVALTGLPRCVARCLAVQDPTGEAASEAQKHLTLYELDLGLNHVVGMQGWWGGGGGGGGAL